MLSIKKWRLDISEKLAFISDTPALDARLLLADVLNLEMYQLETRAEELVSESDANQLETYLARRLVGEPIAYILGYKEFMNQEFIVNSSVLIPRPETELLVETVIKYCGKAKIGLDLCTGSGAIAISLLDKITGLRMDASDISEKALVIAKKNAIKHKKEDRLDLIPSDLFADIASKKYDFIVSNPPYIESVEVTKLATNVKDFEPLLALDGGDDGLNFYRSIAEKSGDYLKAKGALFLEIGSGQFADVEKMLSSNGFVKIEVIRDLALHERVVIAFKGERND